jgi:hypothetical protein
MSIAKWYRKIAESANIKFYTGENIETRKANLLNNILLVRGLIILGLSVTSIFLWFNVFFLVHSALRDLPGLPPAAVGHGMNSVSRITSNEELENAIWIAIFPGMWAGGVELIVWTQFRDVPFNALEQVVCIRSMRQIRKVIVNG